MHERMHVHGGCRRDYSLTGRTVPALTDALPGPAALETHARVLCSLLCPSGGRAVRCSGRPGGDGARSVTHPWPDAGRFLLAGSGRPAARAGVREGTSGDYGGLGGALRSGTRAGGRSRRARWALAAVGLAGALTLTACGGDGDGGSDDSAGTPTPSVTRTADSGGGTGGTGGSDGAPAGDLQGSWLTTADGKAVVLMVNGDEAALFATGGTVCSGHGQGRRRRRRDPRPEVPDRRRRPHEGNGDVGRRKVPHGHLGRRGRRGNVHEGRGRQPAPGLPTEGLGS